MKKILLLFALSFLLVPNITHAQDPEDVRAEVDELKDLLEEIMERIEVLEKLLDSDDSVENDEDENQSSDLSPTLELEKKLNQQDIVIEDITYIVQSETRKGLYPDALSAIMTNNTDIDIKHIGYAFVAWDSNGLPLKIETDFDLIGPQYAYETYYYNVNAIPGEIIGKGAGLALDSSMDKITSMKAIVIEYEGFDGELWENPLYDEFLDIYREKRLADIEDHEEVIFYR